MKISKLFHWLYGLVMLLPIFAIGVTCLVNTFNDSPNTNTEIRIEQKPIYYETNELTDSNDFIIGNVYRLTIAPDYNFTGGNTFLFYEKLLNITYSEVNVSASVLARVPYIIKTTSQLRYCYNDGEQEIHVRLYDTGYIDYVHTGYQGNAINDLIAFIEPCPNQYIKEYQDEEVIEYTQNNIFYYSIDKVQQSPLFNWAYNSFLVTPFAYIVSLFSMPTNSFVVMLLSYWLAISIIWLVFDLVMYVPLLIHRWIDKGVLE